MSEETDPEPPHPPDAPAPELDQDEKDRLEREVAQIVGDRPISIRAAIELSLAYDDAGIAKPTYDTTIFLSEAAGHYMPVQEMAVLSAKIREEVSGVDLVLVRMGPPAEK